MRLFQLVILDPNYWNHVRTTLLAPTWSAFDFAYTSRERAIATRASPRLRSGVRLEMPLSAVYPRVKWRSNSWAQIWDK